MGHRAESQKWNETLWPTPFGSRTIFQRRLLTSALCRLISDLRLLTSNPLVSVSPSRRFTVSAVVLSL